ncbi:hypothetical protein HBN63_20675 [Pseudomonas sp. WS 5011]|nr:hypothetical protein [Pseudomonas sp. WS 5011]
MPHWPFLREGETVGFKGEGVFSANSVEAVRTASKQGLGLAMLTYRDVRDDLEENSLQLVELEDATPEQLFITAVLPTRQQVPHRVRDLSRSARNISEQSEMTASGPECVKTLSYRACFSPLLLDVVISRLFTTISAGNASERV